jgi:peptidoglycan/LPS O-acetylase OafA/YrhL
LRRRSTIGESFDPRRNSLNFIRLVLALTVLFSHALTLGGNGSISSEDILTTTPGSVAVFGFFGISGFLIARSAAHNNIVRYLWQRCLRIFPAYWVCLVVTGFVIGVIAWEHGQAIPPHCGLSCYFNSPTGPFQYVYRNAWLKLNQQTIAGSPHGVPLPNVWNISLWTLSYEFLCYAVVGVLAVVGFLKYRILTLCVATAVWGWAAYICFTKDGNLNPSLVRFVGLVPLFLAGTLLYLYWDKIPDSGWLALGSTAVFVACLWLPFGTEEAYAFFHRLNAPALFSVALAYPMIWLGIHLPFHKVGSRNDYSYGIYLYASAVQQLLAVLHVQRWGMFAYMALGLGVTVPLAVASWWIVERHALKLKKLDPRRIFMKERRRRAAAVQQ